MTILPLNKQFSQDSSEYIKSKVPTLEMVKAGLHCSFKISRQMLPLLLMFGWKTFVLKATYKRDVDKAWLMPKKKIMNSWE